MGWAESPSSLELAVDPRHSELAGAVIDWFLDSNPVSPECMVMRCDRITRDALERRGFVADVTGPWFSHHVLELEGLPPLRNVPGYAFRHIEPGEHEARAACHRASWSDFGPSKVSGAAYERLAGTWPYRDDLDWVALSDDDEMVASCLVWFDELNGVGLIEPVGCVPAHRRRGLAAGVSLVALHALRGLGAAMALVNPRGDEAYPAPGLLYRLIGFHPVDRTITYARPGEG